MPLAHTSGTLPTHVLAVLSGASLSPSTKSILPRGSDTLSSTHPLAPSTPLPASSQSGPLPSDPYLIPIDAESFFLAFGHDAARTLGSAALTSKWSKAPSPRVRADRAIGARFVTLPVIPLYVPHPPSLPHVLLFGQGIPLPSASSAVGPGPPEPLQELSGSDSGASALATYLLPLAAIEEFPSAPAMAAAMARQCTPDALSARFAFNHGVWRNVLAMSPADATLVDLVRVAWNVTSDAAQLQGQQQRRDTFGKFSLPPPRHRPAVEASAGVSRTGTRTRELEVAPRDVAKDHAGPTVAAVKPTASILPPATAVPTGLSIPRLPVVEADYPVDFLAKPADVPRSSSFGDTFEKHRSVQCLAPVSPLESSLHGRGTQAVRL
ncbi:hypothetical protein GSI_08816 [Ganoderma sinense ZZ0214-1]|uniref:Uncharacterized protein n=1 Tax=Ganoderma sinense ZZ0214-1 TaxID=1077348 RepID=A0A2G8S4S7_9APHY|nr:hypothetical protein GSI_08816 [Ganoderma sinense ZZ0214-1]